ncbi:preprotein translocase subunit SecG [Thermodesulfitimonas autotrophica]|uniref:Protein-export membrane protein SecG n=1 Tax=Thermodesulfitimonas autotrophica TaxID=1894989 RepID=A0A3N5AWU6_9THEO|nr:preprotein translocase subunit SecG [Thermodesulfitimonas autotrophica]RPF49363.1 preprotein translocase subunit SecG [Thermodesulfitimonas autotrophica]
MLKGIVTAVYVLICLLLITVVVLQSGRAAGLSGAIGGGAESLFGKKKGLDEWLAKVTVWVAVLFGALSLLLVIWR